MLKITKKRTMGWLVLASTLVLIIVILSSATFGPSETLAGLGTDADEWLVLAGSTLLLAAPVLRRLR
jgi:hypothetical protein